MLLYFAPCQPLPAHVARCPKRAATHTAPGRAVVGPRRGFVPQAPTVQTYASAGAPAATLRPRRTSAESFFSYCNSVVALALANCNEHVAEANITAPAHTQRVLHGAQGS